MTHTCRHCSGEIAPCKGGATPVCLGWIHVAYAGRHPVGAHYCEARSINPSAEPRVHSTALVPLERVRFADGAVRAVPPLPRNTLDIRYSACGSHHTACDCREAMLAEDIGEYRLMFRQLEDAILAAIKGHQTYAYTADGYTDEFAQCKCPACVIARAAHVGYCEAIQARRETSERLEQDRIERERATYARMYPDLDEVPF